MKPYLIKTYAFDAELDKEMFFTWAGNQIFGVEVMIENNDTSSVAFIAKYDLMKNNFLIPADSLINGNQYTIKIRVWDVNQVFSEYSDKQLFYCFTTPTWKFKNIHEQISIETPTLIPELVYEQAENEPISEYNILLYDTNQKLLFQTGALFDENLSTTITGLMNDTIYYVRATCSTVNGIEADTGYIKIYVRYILPNFYSIVYAENHPKKGYIKLSSNIKIIDYTPKDGFTFIDDKYVDLRDMELTYIDGFTIPKQFTCIFILKDFDFSENVFEMSNEDDCHMEITPLRMGSNMVFRLRDHAYTIYSKPLPVTDHFVKVWFRRNDGLYDIFVTEVM